MTRPEHFEACFHREQLVCETAGVKLTLVGPHLPFLSESSWMTLSFGSEPPQQWRQPAAVMGPIRGRPNAPASQKAPLPPPLPTCPGRPHPLRVTESSRHRVCLRACELPKLIVMVLSRAERAGCFLAHAVGFHKRTGGAGGASASFSGAVARMKGHFCLWVRDSGRRRLSPAPLQAVVSLLSPRLVVHTGDTPTDSRGRRGLLPGASPGLISSGNGRRGSGGRGSVDRGVNEDGIDR